MKPSEREAGHADFLQSAFVSIPYGVLSEAARCHIAPDEFMVLLQVLGASQVERRDFLTPQEIGERCGLSPLTASEIIERLVNRGLLSIGERLESDGTQTHYFDLKPLWDRLRGRDPMHTPVQAWNTDPISVFESEFGRPLSGMECEQIRNWLEHDRVPEWLIVEALKEAVLANKYSFKYIDRVLYDWQRHRILSRTDLEQYRQSYRERAVAKQQTAATARKKTAPGGQGQSQSQTASADERYANFYKQYPGQS